MKQQKMEIKMERVVTYATYELISVFAFHSVYTIIPLLHSEYSNDFMMAQLSSTLAAGNLMSGFQSFRPGKIQTRLLIHVLRSRIYM